MKYDEHTIEQRDTDPGQGRTYRAEEGRLGDELYVERSIRDRAGVYFYLWEPSIQLTPDQTRELIAQLQGIVATGDGSGVQVDPVPAPPRPRVVLYVTYPGVFDHTEEVILLPGIGRFGDGVPIHVALRLDPSTDAVVRWQSTSPLAMMEEEDHWFPVLDGEEPPFPLVDEDRYRAAVEWLQTGGNPRNFEVDLREVTLSVDFDGAPDPKAPLTARDIPA